MAPSAADLLDKAVALLDPLGSPPLAAPAVAEAYDLLLGLLALTSTPEAEVPVQVRADALRALLLSSHLLLAIACVSYNSCSIIHPGSLRRRFFSWLAAS